MSRSMVSSSVHGALVLALALNLLAFGGGWVMAGDAALRGMRALTLPFVLFATGLAGHAAAGGVTPDASLLVPMFLLTVFAVVPFAGAPISPAWSMPLLVGGQGLLHAALQLLSGAGVAAPTAEHGMSAGVSAPTSSHLMTHHPGTAASHGDAMSLMGAGTSSCCSHTWPRRSRSPSGWPLGSGLCACCWHSLRDGPSTRGGRSQRRPAVSAPLSSAVHGFRVAGSHAGWFVGQCGSLVS
jgi:hypothetical protein